MVPLYNESWIGGGVNTSILNRLISSCSCLILRVHNIVSVGLGSAQVIQKKARSHEFAKGVKNLAAPQCTSVINYKIIFNLDLETEKSFLNHLVLHE